MSAFIESFRKEAIYRMNENTPRIAKCLEQLSEEEVWKRPNEASNSIGNLILHLCGNIRQYAISSLGNQKDIRERDLEFSTTGGIDKASLLRQLSQTVDEANKTIGSVPESELLRTRKVQVYDMDGIAIVMHVMEHYSYHTGQIAFYTKLLKAEDLGFYKNIDLQ